MKTEEKTKEELIAELAENARSRKGLEDTLKLVEAAKKQWERAVDCINDMVFFADPEEKILRCNKAAMEFIGQPYKNIIGRDWRTLLFQHGIRIDVKNGRVEYDEILHEPTGRWFQITTFGYNDEGPGHVITLHDETKMRNLAESLEVANKWLVSDRRELRFALDEISSLLQVVEKERDLGHRFRSPAHAVSAPIYKIGEQFNSMMEMLESGHKELEKAYVELKTAQSRVLQQEKMASIGQLAAGIAHEINNPTAFILSNLNSLVKYCDRYNEFMAIQAAVIAELAKKGESDTGALLDTMHEKRKNLKLDYVMGDTKQLIQESIDGAVRIKKIAQDLKNFSHVDKAEWKMSNINEGLESTINIVWNELKYKAAVRKDYGNIPLIMCNLRQLNQVFLNILINAVQAIEKVGEIAVKTWHDDDYVSVSISDTGSGIPEDKINRIFEPFYTTKDVGKGTGLGLSITYEIVKKHAGDIMVDSEVGKGTTFTIKIPLQSKETVKSEKDVNGEG